MLIFPRGRPATAARKLAGKEEEIIRLAQSGETISGLAKRFGVSRATVLRFLRQQGLMK